MHTAERGPAPGAPVLVTLADGGPVGIADPRLFGSFVEHVGRGVYGGIYQPSHPSATAEGFRGDVLDLVRELGVTVVRYPGGNFVSGYDWRDGIGPRDRRPRRLDLAWKSIETNEFGTDEFIAWCRAAQVEPMLALNLGLGSVASALALLEYTNHPSGTTISDLRVGNGFPAPHDVRLWCLGNELDGPWQLGHRSPAEYAATAARVATAMRMFDSDLELVAVGSSNPEVATFGVWEETVLAQTVDLVDYLSCHIYFYNDGDLPTFLRSSDRLDGFLDTIADIIARAKKANEDARDVRISLDEWNVWNFAAYDALKPSRDFEVAPRILEDAYTVADAVVVGTLLQSILSHADVVSIAAMAQLVNVIGPIRAEPDAPAWRQTTFYPFAAAARSSGCAVQRTHVTSHDLIATVTTSPDAGTTHVYLANRSCGGPIEVEVELAGLAAGPIRSSWVLADEDVLATNTAEAPVRVAPARLAATLESGTLRTTLPSVSWAHIEISGAGEE